MRTPFLATLAALVAIAIVSQYTSIRTTTSSTSASAASSASAAATARSEPPRPPGPPEREAQARLASYKNGRGLAGRPAREKRQADRREHKQSRQGKDSGTEGRGHGREGRGDKGERGRGEHKDEGAADGEGPGLHAHGHEREFFARMEAEGARMRAGVGGGGGLAINPKVRCGREEGADDGGKPKTVLVTSSSATYIRLRKRVNFEHSLWGKRSPYPLWLYHENRWEELHGREPLEAGELPQADCFVDIFDAVSGLEEALTAEDGLIDRFYRIDGVRSLSDSIMDGKALIRKVAAMAHAASELPDGSRLVWVDVDTSVDNAFDGEFEEFAAGLDLAYLVEVLCRRDLANASDVDGLPGWCKDFKIETGVFVVSVSPRTRRFLRRALMWYDGPMLALAQACLGPAAPRPEECQVNWIRNNIGLNDVFVLNLLMHQEGHANLRQGWLANKPFLCEEHLSSLLGHCSACPQRPEPAPGSGKPGARTLVSPFFVEDYITHHHDASGIMTLLHDPNYLPPESQVLKKDKTKDKEMILPETWPSQDHLDPRPACDDARLRPDCFHSVRCGVEKSLTTPRNDELLPLSIY
mmetsp:Transcript_26525/g.64086  ORF Transcript_26525/g.64086 Transcript_26525/m.64086 type:complete len:584 (-) Transcript_26525:310-2061(-)